MRTTKVLSITLPEAMLDAAKKRAKLENRTMSELVREASRRYEMRWLDAFREYAQPKADALGIHTEEDVDRVIHEYGAEQGAAMPLENKTRRKAS